MAVKVQVSNKLLAVIVLMIVVSMVMFVYFSTRLPKDVPPYYTPEPETWLTDEINYKKTTHTVVDVEKATKGLASVDETHQRYVTPQGIIGFFYSGAYKGEYFQTMYIEPEFYNASVGKSEAEVQELVKQYTKMQISNIITPGDGIIEGIVIGRIDGVRLDFYVFVDEDWKEQVGPTNIIIGENMQDMGSLASVPFTYAEEERGVYFQKVSGQIAWFRQVPRKAGVAVGDIDIKNVVDENTEGKTIMVLR